jgi:hypothetical protein
VALSTAGMLAFGAARIKAEESAYGAPAAPWCVPSQLNRSAVLPGTRLAVSPLPDSLDASARTQISLLGQPASALSHISVRGSRSGAHRGSLRAYSQGDGASFVPAKPFIPGETVTVHGRVKEDGHERDFAFIFTTAHEDPIEELPPPKYPNDYNEMQHFVSAPRLEPPVLDVTTQASGHSEGDIFDAPYSGPGPSGPEIFTETGELVWFDPLPPNRYATNLQVQQLYGKPVLTWWQGYIPRQGFGEGEEVIDNTSYQQIGRVHAGNGYTADLHDFHITPEGTALITVYNPIACNLTAIGGPQGGAANDSIFQEIDLATGLVRREWTSLDHVGFNESYSGPEGASPEWPYDYFHINSIDRTSDGTTLISARNTWSLFDLNTTTGQVDLRIGGKHSEVTGSGTSTAFQHDATQLADGMITIFDNGALPKVHPQSRVLVVSLEPKTKTDTLLALYEHSSPALSAGSQGGVQTLPDGNLFIGWGADPYFSEYAPDGKLLYDAHMHGSYQTYRAYRFPWAALPAGRPAIAAASANGRVTLFASWNGATQIASWQAYGGSTPAKLTPVGSASKDGFETAIGTSGDERYVAVQALAANGSVLGTSNTIRG